MEQSKPLSHITAGLLIAAVLVIYSIIVNFLQLTSHAGVSFIQWAIIIGGLILVVNLYGKAHNHRVTFGNLFAYGFKTTAVFTILFVAFTVLFFLLFPDLKEKTFEMAREQMEKQKGVTDEQIEQALAMSRKFFWVGVVGGSMLFMIILGAIGSAIGAAVTKKQPHNPFEQPII
jgi:predicted MFS family arabinose efflux permease